MMYNVYKIEETGINAEQDKNRLDWRKEAYMFDISYTMRL
jgi:hypothetical protein